MTWSGMIYASATLTGNGNTGWVAIPSLTGLGTPVPMPGYKHATLYLVPANLATDETLDMDLNVAWDAAGASDLKLHDFAQVTSTNAPELLILPGGESEALLAVDTTGGFGALIPPYWKLTWTLGGTTKSMSFSMYASVEW